jgi:hypothetical protein
MPPRKVIPTFLTAPGPFETADLVLFFGSKMRNRTHVLAGVNHSMERHHRKRPKLLNGRVKPASTAPGSGSEE